MEYNTYVDGNNRLGLSCVSQLAVCDAARLLSGHMHTGMHTGWNLKRLEKKSRSQTEVAGHAP